MKVNKDSHSRHQTELTEIFISALKGNITSFIGKEACLTFQEILQNKQRKRKYLAIDVLISYDKKIYVFLYFSHNVNFAINMN